jgi:hypothetical protein
MKFTQARRALQMLVIVSAAGGVAVQAQDQESPSGASMIDEVVANQARQVSQSIELQKQINELRSRIDSLSAQCGKATTSNAAAAADTRNSAVSNCVQQQVEATPSCVCTESVRTVQPASVRQSLQWVETNRYRVLVPASQAAALLSQTQSVGRNVYSTIPSSELSRSSVSMFGTGQVQSFPSTYSVLPQSTTLSNGIVTYGQGQPVYSTSGIVSPAGALVTNGTGVATYGGYGFTTPATTNAMTLRGDVIQNDVWPASGGLRTHIVSDSGWQTVYYRGANGISISPSPQFPQAVIGR